MKPLTLRLRKMYAQSQHWAKDNSTEALQLMIILVAALAALTVFACFLLFREQSVPPLQPAPRVGATTTTGWVFVARVPAGSDYCDMYTKGGISRSKCFTRTKDGKWRFNNVY